jgi:hypothetical protein
MLQPTRALDRKPCMRRLYCAVTVLLVTTHVHAAPLDHGNLVTFPTREG